MKELPKSNISTILITGANAGLGKETARLLASSYSGVTKIYLACRNSKKAEAAKNELEAETQRTNLFEIVIVDMYDQDSCKKAAENLPEEIDAIMMNAGGMGGEPGATMDNGALKVYQQNILGHPALLQELLRLNKLKKCAVFSGSEAARGVASFGMPAPDVQSGSVDEFVSFINGSFTESPKVRGDTKVVYGMSKLVGTYYMGHLARIYPSIKFVTVSPGATAGTGDVESYPLAQRLFIKCLFGVLSLLRITHDVTTGAQRYVDVLLDTDGTFETGKFYGSREAARSPLCDQQKRFPALFYKPEWEGNAYVSIQKFIGV